MSEKPEYWILSNSRVKELINELHEIGESILANLSSHRLNVEHPYSIWKLKATQGWIGFTIEKVENNQRIVFWISLNNEVPIEFTTGLRYWKQDDPVGTGVDVFQSTYRDIHEIGISELSDKLMSSLQNIPLFPQPRFS